MSINAYNTAIEAARQAYATHDHLTFFEAIDKAKLAIAHHPPLVEKLTQAQELFPSPASLEIIAAVSLALAELAVNPEL